MAIHTPLYASKIANLLEANGVRTKLEDFVSFKSPITVAQRIKIRAKDLPLSLKILENPDLFLQGDFQHNVTGMSGELLIPVDFSQLGDKSVEVGFFIAEKLNLKPVLIHAYIGAGFNIEKIKDRIEKIPTDQLNSQNSELLSVRKMGMLKQDIRRRQKEGKLPPLKFKTILRPGLPEEVILDYCKENLPRMVVMATRGIKRKGEELIGSITAEVLDSCRIPVFTLPEFCDIAGIEDIKNIVFFCKLDSSDIISLDSLFRIFNYPHFKITVVPSIESFNHLKYKVLRDRMTDLVRYFRGNYTNAEFEVFIPSKDGFASDLDALTRSAEIHAFLMPAKKASMFSRLFKPTLAHKSLFERDVPMIVIPV